MLQCEVDCVHVHVCTCILVDEYCVAFLQWQYCGNVGQAAMVEVGLAGGPWSLTDHGKKAEEKIRTNPYDWESWNVLIREAQVGLFVCVCVYVLIYIVHMVVVKCMSSATQQIVLPLSHFCTAVRAHTLYIWPRTLGVPL